LNIFCFWATSSSAGFFSASAVGFAAESAGFAPSEDADDVFASPSGAAVSPLVAGALASPL